MPKIEDTIIALFRVSGFNAYLSEAGLKTKLLITQLGGDLQDCRILKIPGIRDLFCMLKSTITQDLSKIKNILEGYKDSSGQEPKEKRKKFQDQGKENFIKANESVFELRANGILKVLLEKKILQTGLLIECMKCANNIWLSLAQGINEQFKCEACSNINATPNHFTGDLKIKCSNCKQAACLSLARGINEDFKCQYCFHLNFLPNKLITAGGKWKVRLSGILSADEQGSIPVALALQRLDCSLGSGCARYYMPSLKLKLSKDNECETDICFITQSLNYGFHGRKTIQIVIGEIKSNMGIDAEDITKLNGVKDVLHNAGFDVFLLFAKLTTFTQAEIELCKKEYNPAIERIIMLTDKEMELYLVLNEVQRPISTLEELAQLTSKKYFA